MFTADAVCKRGDIGVVGVVTADRDAGAAGVADQIGGVRQRAPGIASSVAGAQIDRRPAGAELDRLGH